MDCMRGGSCAIASRLLEAASLAADAAANFKPSSAVVIASSEAADLAMNSLSSVLHAAAAKYASVSLDMQGVTTWNNSARDSSEVDSMTNKCTNNYTMVQCTNDHIGSGAPPQLNAGRHLGGSSGNCQAELSLLRDAMHLAAACEAAMHTAAACNAAWTQRRPDSKVAQQRLKRMVEALQLLPALAPVTPTPSADAPTPAAPAPAGIHSPHSSVVDHPGEPHPATSDSAVMGGNRAAATVRALWSRLLTVVVRLAADVSPADGRAGGLAVVEAMDLALPFPQARPSVPSSRHRITSASVSVTPLKVFVGQCDLAHQRTVGAGYLVAPSQ